MRHILIKFKERCDDTYCEYEIDGDTYLKTLSLKVILRKLENTLIEELKIIRFHGKCI